MPRVTFKIPWNYRAWLFGFILLSWCSGVTYYVLDHYFEFEGEFGPQKHPWQQMFLNIHGAAAFLMMIAYGFMLASHVPSGWKAQRSRKLGLTLLIAQGFLIITAYFLYYAGWGHETRQLLVWSHAGVGFIFPFLLVCHLFTGRKSRSEKAQ